MEYWIRNLNKKLKKYCSDREEPRAEQCRSSPLVTDKSPAIMKCFVYTGRHISFCCVKGLVRGVILAQQCGFCSCCTLLYISGEAHHYYNGFMSSSFGALSHFSRVDKHGIFTRLIMAFIWHGTMMHRQPLHNWDSMQLGHFFKWSMPSLAYKLGLMKIILLYMT